MSLHLKDQILLGQILVTFACSRCLYLDAQSENLSGLADEFFGLGPRAGCKRSWSFGCKATRAGGQTCRTGQSVQHRCKVPAADTEPFSHLPSLHATSSKFHWELQLIPWTKISFVHWMTYCSCNLCARLKRTAVFLDVPVFFSVFFLEKGHSSHA